MDIIQEAKDYLAHIMDGHTIEVDLISRLVDRLEWKLIESAPKDGTRVLAMRNDESKFMAVCFKTIAPHDSRSWMIDDYNGGLFYPTHWLPLSPVGDK